MDSIDKYFFVGEYDINELKKAHEMVIYFKRNLFSGEESHLIQDLFLNRGARIDDEKRPKSFFDLYDHVIPRTTISAGLFYLQHMIELMTKPELAVVHKPTIYTDGVSGLIIPSNIKENISVTTPTGIDFSKLEHLQTEWLKRTDIVPLVRELEKKLQSSFEEHNLKWVLSAIYHAERSFIPNDWEDILKLSDKIKTVPWRNVFSHLDDAYYNTACRYAKGTSNVVEKLLNDDYGKLFVIAPDEVKEFIRLSASKTYY